MRQTKFQILKERFLRWLQLTIVLFNLWIFLFWTRPTLIKSKQSQFKLNAINFYLFLDLDLLARLSLLYDFSWYSYFLTFFRLSLFSARSELSFLSDFCFLSFFWDFSFFAILNPSSRSSFYFLSFLSFSFLFLFYLSSLSLLNKNTTVYAVYLIYFYL